ncbi:MAG: M56 family metallopeptidase [Erythrobacter sp.]
MITWLLETLTWTAVLIALVLVIRRPVARWFGPGFAYALWAIPFLRLVLPPLELPAWMNPAPEPLPSQSASESVVINETQFQTLDSVTPVATQVGPGGTEAAATDVLTPHSFVPDVDIGPFVDAGLAVWFIGAAIFLYLRFAAYFRLRAELLEGASEVGCNRLRSGARVRLIETDGTDAPLAFGVVDKVIALPRGFLAQPDLRARDLALAHEMEHHKGRDLLTNVLVQPLFALHWFNPLGRYGWLALRRDQEAACDARVMAAMAPEVRPETRNAYANLIVSFAAGPNIALAAPMACPVLGEKSIVHRLRSLKMNDTPKSRRLAGRLMLGAAVVALPLTASITYAASEAPLPPAPPAAPEAAAPGIARPAPPVPPAPPAPPAPAPLVQQDTIVEVDPDVDVEVARDVRRSENVFVTRVEDGDKHRERRVVRRGQLSDEEMAEIMAEVRESLAEARKELDELPHVIEEAMAEAREAQGQHRTVVEMSCDSSTSDVATTIERADGVHVVKLCQARVMVKALEGLKEARAEIARNREMTEEMREQVVRQLDREISRWERDAR